VRTAAGQYGLFLAVVPRTLGEYLGGKDRKGAERAMRAMMGMVNPECEGAERRLCRKPRRAGEKPRNTRFLDTRSTKR